MSVRPESPRFDLRFLAAPIFAGLCLMSLIAPATADDWPFWRGPDRNDQSSETGLLKSWPEDGPPRVWMNQNAGLGYAGFAVVGDRLFTMGLEDNEEFGLCLNANDGKEIWRTPIGSRYENRWGDGPRSTPTVDGEMVYFMTGQGELAALRCDSGDTVWSISMSEFGGEVPKWGYAESPLVDDDQVVCTPGGSQGTMLAVDKMTGKKIWQTVPISVTKPDGTKSGPAEAHYSSILPAEIHGNRQYVQLLVNAVVGVAPETGQLLWSHPFPGRVAVIPSPMVFDNQVYVTAGYGVGSRLLSIGPDNAVTEEWASPAMQNHHGGVIKLGDYIYGFSAKTFNGQSLKDGEMAWGERDIKKGALTFADGRIIYIQKDDGKVMLLEVTPEGSKEISSFTLSPQTERRAPQGRIWVHPVVANGKLYLRDQEIIQCFDISGN